MYSIDLLHVCGFQGSSCGNQKILGILAGQKISEIANDSNSGTYFIPQSSSSE
jgi:hypothetical protein